MWQCQQHTDMGDAIVGINFAVLACCYSHVMCHALNIAMCALRLRKLHVALGIENGWSAIVLTGSGMLDSNEDIRVLPGLHETRSKVAASEGFRVVVHPPDLSLIHI